MQTMRRIDVQINGKLVGSCDSISKISSPLFKDILDPWFDIKGFVPEKASLNENQQIVLEWLKLTAPTGKPMQVVFWMMNNAAWGHLDELRDPLMELTDKEQFEVLAAFAEWGMKNG
ncbi:hypothetical protein P7H39_04000 [Enterococcus durans]|uniref:hypothetical protein n=1 Tax=Enterococcus durans TaxID=53345 RepID=UPI00288D12C4|nr:hypothetical protein [Enterococcus durans]MDT2772715.1 hypothetical protein [Enterococcus durans]